MLERGRRRARSQDGFTLIELLVVVVIVGILAAIAVPQFIGQRKKADPAVAVALLHHGSVTFESYNIGAQAYPTTPAAAVTAMKLVNPSIAWKAGTATVPPRKNEVVILTSTATTYSLQAAAGAKAYRYARAANGKVTRSIVGAVPGSRPRVRRPSRPRPLRRGHAPRSTARPIGSQRKRSTMSAGAPARSRSIPSRPSRKCFHPS